MRLNYGVQVYTGTQTWGVCVVQVYSGTGIFLCIVVYFIILNYIF